MPGFAVPRIPTFDLLPLIAGLCLLVTSASAQNFSVSVGGQRSLEFHLPPKTTYQLYWSRDLQTWNQLGDTFLPRLDRPFRLDDSPLGFVRLLPQFKVPDKEITIVLIGDSTVADLSWTSPIHHGWGQLLGSFFTDQVRIANLAEGGISTQKFLDEERFDVVERIGPDFVFLQFGQIDRWANLALPRFEANLRTIIDQIRALNAIPVLVTPVAQRAFTEQGTIDEIYAGYRQVGLRLASQLRVAFIDLNRLSTDLYNRYGKEETSFVTVCGNECTDLAHFSSVGAYVMGALVLETAPPILQPYRIRLDSLLDPIVDAFAHDQNFLGHDKTFQELTGLPEKELWDWVFAR